MLLMLFMVMIVIAPLGLLIHELGHAIPALVMNSERSVITIGSGRQLFHIHLGRLHIHVHLFFFHGAYSSNQKKTGFTSSEKALISIGGPLGNGIVFFLLVTSPFNQLNIIHIFILFNGYLALVNTIPFCFKDRKSDGYCFIQDLKNNYTKSNSWKR